MEESFEIYLCPTELIDSGNSIVSMKAVELTQYCQTTIDKVLMIYNFVRDEIKFGWMSHFYNIKASELIETKIGYSQTKTTLFIALLRSIGIPARPKFVELSSKILYGYGMILGEHIDHSYSEVLIDHTWYKVDGYIIDRDLYSHAKQSLIANSRIYGYGIHLYGNIEWDGQSDCMIQAVNHHSTPNLISKEWEQFCDVNDFYLNTTDANEKYDLFFPLNLVMIGYIYIPNWRVSLLRSNLLPTNI